MQNPFQMFSQAMRNPSGFMQQQMLQRMQSQNPQKFQNIMDMVSGKNESQLEEFARNLAKEQGVNIDDTVNSVKSMFGIR